MPSRSLFFFLALVVLIAQAVAGPALAQAVPQSREQVQLSFSPVVKQVAPAVVNIYTRRVVRTVSPMFADPFFRQFFGHQMGLPQERVQRSLGSGVIVKSDGTVVTNNHVVRDSDEITVVLSDRREFEATLVGADERTDLAVLKINAGNQPLPFLPQGDSDALEVGDLVLAIGNPFGVGQTVTMGIVSALARTAVGGADVRSFIQTDAAINPGNSGGALVDLQGRLIGINSAIFSSGEGGGSIGIGFAIPSTMVKAVLTNIASGGKAVRPWLGASGQAVTAEMFQALKLNRPYGVLVNGVQPGSPAEQAEIKVGDVILAVNGHEIDDPEGLRFRIATLTVGTPTQLTLSRNGQERSVSLTLRPPPETPPRDTSEVNGQNPFTGATVANMNPALAEELGLERVDGGVTIIKVKRGTIASRLQFQPGDVIVKLNGQPISSVSDLKARLAAPAPRWAIAIRRGGETFTLTVGE
ncbi:Do family serine endopeptidase [Telmatospirillum siberiense]|uniref:Serine protease n=1 Tax=Telmatospirillum siberiense TaxID=382514 RepID=A0A2N3PN99_9PROT|nr:Do family serine endopeptidase [Telmatospirillum siberiense]PKU21876.1 serine protease [Telmatospirillum siberiense]